MQITTIEIENVKGFLDGDAATKIELVGAGWHVIAGQNGSGKSSLLRAIALVVSGPDTARQLVSSFAGWVRDGAAAARVQVHVKAHADDRFRGKGKRFAKPIRAEMCWSRGDGPEPSFTHSPARSTSKRVGPWRGPWSNNPKGWLIAGYGPFRRLTGHAPDALRLMVGQNHLQRLVSLFRVDASLLEAVTWFQDLRFRKLDGNAPAGELLDKTIALLDDGLLPDGATVERVDADGLWVIRRGIVVELRELSDGYRVVIALVLDLVRQMHSAYGRVRFKRVGERLTLDMPGVVLIDEIDTHLHVSWQREIGFWLTERFPQVQFIVTTHSPFICQAAKKGGLIRLPAPGEQQGATVLDEASYFKVVNGTVDDAVLTKLFGLDRTRSQRAQALTDEYSRLRAQQLRGGLEAAKTGRLNDLAKQLSLLIGSAAE